MNRYTQKDLRVSFTDQGEIAVTVVSSFTTLTDYQQKAVCRVVGQRYDIRSRPLLINGQRVAV